MKQQVPEEWVMFHSHFPQPFGVLYVEELETNETGKRLKLKI